MPKVTCGHGWSQDTEVTESSRQPSVARRQNPSPRKRRSVVLLTTEDRRLKTVIESEYRLILFQHPRVRRRHPLFRVFLFARWIPEPCAAVLLRWNRNWCAPPGQMRH